MLFFISNHVFGFSSEADIEKRLDELLIQNYVKVEVHTNVRFLGTFYDRIELYKDKNDRVVSRKGWVTRDAGEYSEFLFYQNGTARNLLRVGIMHKKSFYGQNYDRITFYQTGAGKNLAIRSTMGDYVFFQKGNFRNICAQDADYFYNDPLKIISRDEFKELFKEFFNLITDEIK